MAGDKVYPAKDASGHPISMTASEYKTALAKTLKVDTNLISHRVAGAAWSSDAQIYDHLASTVTAIEQGQTTNWAPKNLISGMNAASLDVRAASIDLLGICRKELEKLDDIKKDKRLNAKEQEAKIAEQKQYIFGLLEDIRNANAPEKTMQWSRNFFSSIGSKLSSSFTRGNIGLAIVGVAVCVAMNIIVHAVSLAALGALAPYALPFVIGAVALFWLVKMVIGVSNAYQEASKTADQAKSAAGDKVLEHAAKFKETDPEIPKKKQKMDDAKSAMDQAQQAVDTKVSELNDEVKEFITKLKQGMTALTVEDQQLTANIRARGTTLAKKQACQDKMKANSLEFARLGAFLKALEKDPIDIAALTHKDFANIKNISKALTGYTDSATSTVVVGLNKVLENTTKDFKKEEKVYNDAMKDVGASRARAAKEPKTPAQRTLKERLEDTTKPAAGNSGGPSFSSKR